jgi:flagellar basal-body rod protein FlgG
MLQGLYSAASGMEAQQTQFDAVANDLANLDTPGYQAVLVGFQDLLYSPGGASTGSPIATGTGAAATFSGRSDQQGALQTTGRNLDVAIQGEGYIQVKRPDGTIALTRNGALQVDASGQLVNQEGDPLYPPVHVPSGVDPGTIAIAANGTVSAGSTRLGTIPIVTVPAPNQLLADGDSMFSVTTASGATRAATGSMLQQGALESSNVDVAQTMSSMITAERNYQMAGEALQYQDQMLQIANGLKK